MPAPTAQVDIRHDRLIEDGTAEIGPAEVGLEEVGPTEEDPAEADVEEVASAEVGMAEIGPDEAGPAKVDPAEVGRRLASDLRVTFVQWTGRSRSHARYVGCGGRRPEAFGMPPWPDSVWQSGLSALFPIRFPLDPDVKR